MWGTAPRVVRVMRQRQLTAHAWLGPLSEHLTADSSSWAPLLHIHNEALNSVGSSAGDSLYGIGQQANLLVSEQLTGMDLTLDVRT